MIVTEGCGIGDIIHNRAGYMVKYDENELKNAMYTILTDEILISKFGINGKHLIDQEFNLPSIINEIENLYKEILN